MNLLLRQHEDYVLYVVEHVYVCLSSQHVYVFMPCIVFPFCTECLCYITYNDLPVTLLVVMLSLLVLKIVMCVETFM